jgi:hypothetical protein
MTTERLICGTTTTTTTMTTTTTTTTTTTRSLAEDFFKFYKRKHFNPYCE